MWVGALSANAVDSDVKRGAAPPLRDGRSCPCFVRELLVASPNSFQIRMRFHPVKSV
jgi:hypothetical protein